MSRPSLQLSKRIFAWASSHRNPTYERWVEARKRELFGPIRGSVLEIGAGAGANFPYFPRDIRYIAVEPNRFMHRHLQKEADRLGMQIEILACRAEEIPIGDRSVDAVVGTLVLCSVGHPEKVLLEIQRVLKPGGSYYFIEHVAAPPGSFLRKIQRGVRPCWKLASDGCHPDRETPDTIRGSGFGTVEIEHFRVAAPVVGPHISGRAVRL